MSYLLDTCTFLWWSLNPELLSERIMKIISDQTNKIYISSASCWEIVIKYNIDRLELPSSPNTFIIDEIQENSFSVLPITPPHVFELLSLPDIHKDPFDRILIAQSKNERFSFLTNDKTIQRYHVDTIW